jgi:hypothetical protein
MMIVVECRRARDCSEEDVYEMDKFSLGASVMSNQRLIHRLARRKDAFETAGGLVRGKTGKED